MYVNITSLSYKGLLGSNSRRRGASCTLLLQRGGRNETAILADYVNHDRASTRELPHVLLAAFASVPICSSRRSAKTSRYCKVLTRKQKQGRARSNGVPEFCGAVGSYKWYIGWNLQAAREDLVSFGKQNSAFQGASSWYETPTRW